MISGELQPDTLIRADWRYAFVYRYTNFDDGLCGTEGSFVICTFWLADNLIQLGELDEARKLFDAAMGCANDLGLLSEEFDATTGEMLGNFPQAFSHPAMINTAVQLQQAAGESSPVPTGPNRPAPGFFQSAASVLFLPLRQSRIWPSSA